MNGFQHAYWRRGTRLVWLAMMVGPSIVGSASRGQRKLRRLGTVGAALIGLIPLTVATSALVATTRTASAALITSYSSTVTIPIPPASNYAGAGGGDGWAIALSNTQVFNIFHHNGATQLSCHNQSDASACYPVRTITDGSANNFATSGHPGMFLNQNTGKLYTYGTRGSDSTAGVICIDTTLAATNPNPFCGYTALTAVNDGPLSGGISGLSNPMQVGTKWYAFNFVNGKAAGAGAGGQNTLLCFDLTTFAACAGQPITVNIGAGTVGVNSFPTPATAALGTEIIIPTVTGGNSLLACWDASTGTNCSGSWPAAAPISYPGNNGAPFAELDPTGKLIGLCLPTGTDECYNLMGARVATPPGMTAAIGVGSASWDGTGLVLGPRVYVPAWSNIVYCYDSSTSASCPNFPKLFNNLFLLYTVNPDPQRPTCIWVNADGGSAQIQNFDAYSGGACGQGPIRVLAAQFVVNTPPCLPATYTSLQVLQPLPSTYTSGTVQFLDAGGNPILGAANRPLDATGTVDLTGLNLNTATGLPQFLITLTGATGNPGQIVVKLTWTGNYDPNCGSAVTTPTTVATMLSGGGQSGGHITVPAGTQVTDTATMSGLHAGSAGGTVTYTVYSDNTCTTVVQAGSAQAIMTPGVLPPSAPVTMNNAGIFYWLASYSGDGANFPSTSICLDETVTVTPATGTVPPTCALTNVIAGPPAQIQVTVQAADVGLATVTATTTNATVVIDPFVPGTKNPVIITATKIDQTLPATLDVIATDISSNQTICDPAVVTDGTGKPTHVTIDGSEGKVVIANSGLRALSIEVNGQTFALRDIAGQTSLSLNISSALKAGPNVVTIHGQGSRGTSAIVVFSS
jgi:hypothetical protein